MGCEMLYILNQRLQAQKIDKQKCQKVLVDVSKSLFSRQFISEIFNEQELPLKADVRKVFDRHAHSSIMRLNQKSMSKLYDLMIMGFKRQILSTTQPEDLLAILLNHLESVEEFIKGTSEVELVRQVISQSKSFYTPLTAMELYALRATLLDFYQDSKIRISLLLRNKTQLPNGHLAVKAKGPVGAQSEVPGTIRFFSADGKVRSTTSVVTCENTHHKPHIPSDILSPKSRTCKLGLNIYLENPSSVDEDQQNTNAKNQTGNVKSVETTKAADSKLESRSTGIESNEGQNSSHSHRKSQLVQLQNISETGAGQGFADISLTFGDFFVRPSVGNNDNTSGETSVSIKSTGNFEELSIDHSGKAASTKNALEAKIGFTSNEHKKSEAKTADSDVVEEDDLLSMMDAAAM